LTLKLGQYFLAREGMTITNLRAIENIDKIDKVFFDLTGTLTEGKLEVIEASQNKDNFYAIANKLEQESNHPVAVAIKNYTNYADVVTTDCKIGNAKQLGIDYQGTEHRIYVKQKDNVLGFFVVKDKLRKNAKELIRETNIKKIAILSGAPQTVVDSYKTELNVQEVHGGVINKDEIINKYQTTNHSIARSASDVAIHNAMMVGDALNDRSAMQTSKIGVFVGKDNANIAGCYDIKLNNIEQLPKFIDLSKRVKNHMKQNLIISIAYNVIMLVISSGALLAYGIMMPPVLCAGLMILQSLFVLLNTYRFSLSMQAKNNTPAPFEARSAVEI
jgi:P-type E1-E2 ATPase